MADTLALGASAERRRGSNPLGRTITKKPPKGVFSLLFVMLYFYLFSFDFFGFWEFDHQHAIF